MFCFNFCKFHHHAEFGSTLTYLILDIEKRYGVLQSFYVIRHEFYFYGMSVFWMQWVSKVRAHPKFDISTFFVRFYETPLAAFNSSSSKIVRSLLPEIASYLARTRHFWNSLLVSKVCTHYSCARINFRTFGFKWFCLKRNNCIRTFEKTRFSNVFEC